ncbi:MAG TPA: hypothetical protein VLF59_03155 [Candidatus Saccharimonadales bacterium]|nr:hypothetical protein [Candidatus Saccharimonadales bacterium]
MPAKKHLIRTALLWATLIGFMMLTRPQKLPALLLIVPFVLLFAALVHSWVLLVPFARHLTGKRGYAGSRRLRFTVCGGLVLVLVLQSLGQLTVRDFCTIIAIMSLGYLYVGRSRSQSAGR